jgi:hypothetical protein
MHSLVKKYLTLFWINSVVRGFVFKFYAYLILSTTTLFFLKHTILDKSRSSLCTLGINIIILVRPIKDMLVRLPFLILIYTVHTSIIVLLADKTNISLLYNEDLDLCNIVCFKKNAVKELNNYLPHNRTTHYYFNPIATCEDYMLSFKLVMKDTAEELGQFTLQSINTSCR